MTTLQIPNSNIVIADSINTKTQINEFLIDIERNIKEIFISACYSLQNTRGKAEKEYEEQCQRYRRQKEKEEKEEKELINTTDTN